jgi:glycosyltransferase A (GT-A) superfamily protein (DUF2064 family)
VSVVAKKGEGLAAGLTFVWRHFTAADGQQAIAFSSDCPCAFELLVTRDLILGPTNDGGYYLFGAKAAHPSVFEGKGLGTASALDRRLRRAKVLRFSLGLAEPYCDIDVAEDLIRLVAELQRARTPARTAVRLKRWKDAMTQLRAGAGDL